METAKSTDSQASTKADLPPIPAPANVNEAANATPVSAATPTTTPVEPSAPKPRTRRERLAGMALPDLAIDASFREGVSVRLEPEDLMLEFHIRIYGHECEVFNQQRQVSIWKGAATSGTYRYLAGSDIATQLRGVMRNIDTRLSEFTGQVEQPLRPAPVPPQIGYSEPELLDGVNLNVDFPSGPQPATLPPAE